MPELRIGTSAFIAAGWKGSFYPEKMQPRANTKQYNDLRYDLN
jgi:uncharacterized protein YecE (DUF72 family)